MTPINWDDVEPRIKPHVIAVRNRGWDTTSSCEHEMTIDVLCEPQSLPRLHRDLVSAGYQDFELTYRLDGKIGHATITFGGELAGTGEPFDYVLLKVDPKAHPLYFILKRRRYHEPSQSSDKFFYEEHSCPSNWMCDTIEVISKGDQDPHGFAAFVRSVSAPHFDEEAHGKGWAELFPEIAASGGGDKG